MTEKRVKELVGLWKHRLGLDLWDIDVVVGDFEEPDYAELKRSVSYDRALLRIQAWAVAEKAPPREDMMPSKVTPHFLETCIVHELLHAVHRDYTAVILDDLDGFLHRDAQEMLERMMKRIDEQHIDRLARALVLAWNEEH